VKSSERIKEKFMKLSQISAMALFMITASIASAHAPKVGANGGAQADAGSFHVEIVPQGTTLQVFLRDHSNKAVLTDGYKGTAIFIIDGKPQRIPLTSVGENKLAGTSTVSIPSEPKGAVQITTPSGSTVQAKFN
jgi:hypothetical protein